MSDRGMKKWAPFSSLIEQSTCLEQMRYEKNKISKPLISNERAEKINNVLVRYQGQEVEIKYFYDGYIYLIVTTIKRIDKENRKLILENGPLYFRDIIDLNSK